jgi:hypothetical protein
MMSKFTDKLAALRAKFDALPPVTRRIILGVIVLALGFVLGRCSV